MQVFYKAKLFNTRDISNTTTHSFFSSLPTKKNTNPIPLKAVLQQQKTKEARNSPIKKNRYPVEYPRALIRESKKFKKK